MSIAQGGALAPTGASGDAAVDISFDEPGLATSKTTGNGKKYVDLPDADNCATSTAVATWKAKAGKKKHSNVTKATFKVESAKVGSAKKPVKKKTTTLKRLPVEGPFTITGKIKLTSGKTVTVSGTTRPVADLQLRHDGPVPHPRGRAVASMGTDAAVNEEDSEETGGEFQRDTDYIPDRITAGGRTPEHGPTDVRLWPVEPGRYRLVAARACPWASRAIIVRQLLGLEDVISLGLCGPTHDERSWTFDLDPGGVDPVLGIERLQRGLLRPVPGLPAGDHRAGDGRRPDRAGGDQRLPAGSPTTSSSSGASTTGRTHRTCGPTTSARRWRR